MDGFEVPVDYRRELRSNESRNQQAWPTATHQGSFEDDSRYRTGTDYEEDQSFDEEYESFDEEEESFDEEEESFDEEDESFDWKTGVHFVNHAT